MRTELKVKKAVIRLTTVSRYFDDLTIHLYFSCITTGGNLPCLYIAILKCRRFRKRKDFIQNV